MNKRTHLLLAFKDKNGLFVALYFFGEILCLLVPEKLRKKFLNQLITNQTEVTYLLIDIESFANIKI